MITTSFITQVVHLGVRVVTVLEETISGLWVIKFESDKYQKKCHKKRVC